MVLEDCQDVVYFEPEDEGKKLSVRQIADGITN